MTSLYRFDYVENWNSREKKLNVKEKVCTNQFLGSIGSITSHVVFQPKCKSHKRRMAFKMFYQLKIFFIVFALWCKCQDHWTTTNNSDNIRNSINKRIRSKLYTLVIIISMISISLYSFGYTSLFLVQRIRKEKSIEERKKASAEIIDITTNESETYKAIPLKNHLKLLRSAAHQTNSFEARWLLLCIIRAY